jgi:hypothetical protein
MEATKSENNWSTLFTIFLTTGLTMAFVGAGFINSFYSENRIYEMSSAVFANIPNATITVEPSSSLHNGGTALIVLGLIFIAAPFLTCILGIFGKIVKRLIFFIN